MLNLRGYEIACYSYLEFFGQERYIFYLFASRTFKIGFGENMVVGVKMNSQENPKRVPNRALHSLA